MDKINFSDIGRKGAVSRLLERAGSSMRHSSAFLPSKNGVVRTSSRLWTEGIDFDLTYFPLKHLGYKCFIGTVGELYAALARPVSINVRISVSSKLEYPQICELWDGIIVAAKEHNISCIDLDLGPSRNGLLVSISISGETDGETENSKKQAKSKDLVCISGNVGGAYLGMCLLQQEKARIEKSGSLAEKMNLDNYKMIAGAYLKPEINPGVLDGLKESGIIPSYGYFIDRGLADAVKRLNEDSGLGVKLYSDKIPFEGNSFELGKRLNLDPMSAALNGGEDYRLLYVISMSDYEKFRHDFQSFSIIGHLAKSDVGTVIVMPTGAELPIRAQGWKETE